MWRIGGMMPGGIESEVWPRILSVPYDNATHLVIRPRRLHSRGVIAEGTATHATMPANRSTGLKDSTQQPLATVAGIRVLIAEKTPVRVEPPIIRCQGFGAVKICRAATEMRLVGRGTIEACRSAWVVSAPTAAQPLLGPHARFDPGRACLMGRAILTARGSQYVGRSLYLFSVRLRAPRTGAPWAATALTCAEGCAGG